MPAPRELDVVTVIRELWARVEVLEAELAERKALDESGLPVTAPTTEVWLPGTRTAKARRKAPGPVAAE